MPRPAFLLCQAIVVGAALTNQPLAQQISDLGRDLAGGGGARESQHVTVRTTEVAPSAFDAPRRVVGRVEVPDTGEGPPMPSAGSVAPVNPESHAQAAANSVADLHVFRSTPLTSGPLRDATNEPSLAANGTTIFYTYNWYAAFSTNGGASFTYINPRTSFPTAGFDFCCDQRVIYDSSRDLFVWALLYVDAAETPKFIRVAVATTASVAQNRWAYWDLKPSDLSQTLPDDLIDFPNLALSANYLYVTATLLHTGSALVYASGVFRLSLDALRLGGFVSWTTYRTLLAESLEPVQSVSRSTTMYLGTHASSTVMEIWSWPESSGPIPHFVTHAAFASPKLSTCFAPDFTNPCGDSDSRVRAGWLSGNVLGFAWSAGALAGAGYPYPYVGVLRVDATTFAVIDEPSIWSTQVAYLYPTAAANARGHVGVVATFVSPTRYPSVAALVRDDESGNGWDAVTVREGTAGPPRNRWGDFMTVVPAGPNFNSWYAGTFTLQGTTVEPLFVWFGRDRDGPNAPAVTQPTLPPSPLPTSTPPPAGLGQARQLLTAAFEIGSGFVSTDTDYSFADKSATPTTPPPPYRTWAEALVGLGWQAASSRDLFNASTGTGVFEV